MPAVAARVLELGEPGAAEHLGHQLRGPLKRCRSIHVGDDHRIVYLCRTADVVVIAIGLRKGDAVYAEAEKAINEVKAPAT